MILRSQPVFVCRLKRILVKEHFVTKCTHKTKDDITTILQHVGNGGCLSVCLVGWMVMCKTLPIYDLWSSKAQFILNTMKRSNLGTPWSVLLQFYCKNHRLAVRGFSVVWYGMRKQGVVWHEAWTDLLGKEDNVFAFIQFFFVSKVYVQSLLFCLQLTRLSLECSWGLGGGGGGGGGMATFDEWTTTHCFGESVVYEQRKGLTCPKTTL